MRRIILRVIPVWVVCVAGLTLLLTGMLSPAGESESKLAVKLPNPPARVPNPVIQSKACIECHEEIVNLLDNDKHIADGLHCVVCHGQSKAHVELEEESKEDALPDRTWRRWIEEEHRYKWRKKNASLEIARFCASCHAEEPAQGKQIKTINWKNYLDTGHGLGLVDGDHDAATCTDCHYAHGAGCEPLTDATVVDRCSLCHGDREMMKRAGLDTNVMRDFQAGTHGDMDSASVDKQSTCIQCHYPH